jgi:hypothetical protein
MDSSKRFLAFGLFHESTPWTTDRILNCCQIRIRIRGHIRILKSFPRVWYPAEPKKMLSYSRGLFQHGSFCPWLVLFSNASNFKKCRPFNGTGKPSKRFEIILGGHEQACWYHTPLNNFMRGIIPLGTNFCGVSYPYKQISAGYHIPRNKFLRIIISLGTNFSGVSYLSKQISAGSYPPEQTSLEYQTHLHKFHALDHVLVLMFLFLSVSLSLSPSLFLSLPLSPSLSLSPSLFLSPSWSMFLPWPCPFLCPYSCPYRFHCHCPWFRPWPCLCPCLTVSVHISVPVSFPSLF